MQVMGRAALAAAVALAALPAGALANATVTFAGKGKPVVVTGDFGVDRITVTRTATDLVVTGISTALQETSPDCVEEANPPAEQEIVRCAGGDRVSIDGQGAADTLVITGDVGEGGENELIGGAGNDTLTGGNFDEIIFPGAGTDVVDGRGGFDYVSYEDVPGPVSITLNAAADDGPAGENDSLSGMEWYTGSPGDDVFAGSAGRDLFEGVGGNDMLDGGAGNDSLDGGAGNDVIRGGEGVDSAFGDTGNDTIDGDAGSDENLDGGAGDDTVRGGADSDFGLKGGAGNDTVEGGPGDDGNLQGGDGNDTVSGGDGDDATVSGGAGNDVLEGGSGDDRLSGGTGTDDLRGGDGIDLATWFPFDLNTGADLPVTISLDGAANDGLAGENDNARADIEDVATGNGADVISGSDVANSITSNGGNDTVDGRGGADRLATGSGNDTLTTRDQTPDVASCGEGTDTLTSDTIDTAFLCEAVNAAPLPPGPDVTPPSPAVTVRSSVRVRDLRRALAVTVDSGTETVAFAFDLVGRVRSYPRIARTGDIVLATTSLKPGVGRRRVSLKIGARQRRGIRRGARLTLRIVATDAAGNSKTLTRSIRVRK